MAKQTFPMRALQQSKIINWVAVSLGCHQDKLSWRSVLLKTSVLRINSAEYVCPEDQLCWRRLSRGSVLLKTSVLKFSSVKDFSWLSGSGAAASINWLCGSGPAASAGSLVVVESLSWLSGSGPAASADSLVVVQLPRLTGSVVVVQQPLLALW